MSRREFIIQEIAVNGRKIKRVVVDDHVDKHKDITDDLILDLVRLLDGIEQLPDDISSPYEYYVTLLGIQDKQYKVVWLLEDDELYIGIVTVYRDDRRK